ncbi:MAG: hypothetical protein R8G01_13730 [Ilumatobacteraceae bacterium]|nr:hypothetical protein [Ilumatobacteraceae bacterium]
MSRTKIQPVVIAAALIVSACTGSSELADDGRGAGADADVDESSLVTMPPVADTTGPDADEPKSGAEPAITRDASIALIDDTGRLGLITDGTVRNDWVKFDAFPSPDRTVAVMTLGPHIQGIGPERPVMWASLPEGEPLAEQTMRTASELTATSLDGTFAGFTTRAGEAIGDAIAGARRTSEIEIISRDDGTVFSQTLDGNFVPEAFSRTTNADGVPSLVFLLEYFPAEAPRFYRVRVLSTETGEVSLPLNLRDKSQQVDERMAGFSRSQVVAEEHGLLFTLYRGTIDGTPDGEPYAFVHTLDFADGVWCLEVDPELELDRLPGSLAAGGDRLYVASANGKVGAYPIPSLSDPGLSPTMDWVVDAVAPGDDAPLITADDEAVHVADPERSGFVAHVHAEGLVHPAVRMFGDAPTAFAWDDDGLQAIGDQWASFGHFYRPDWLGRVVHLVVD